MASSSHQSASSLFKGLYDFGDSLTSYGDFAAYIQKTVLASTALPEWSGVTFSNANFGCQLGLRNNLGIETTSVQTDNPPGIPSTYYSLANPYVAIPTLGTENGPSYAIGGATSGTGSLYDVITIPVGGNNVLLSTVFPKLASTGLQNQILASLNENIQPKSNELTICQGGSNDLLINYIYQNPDIEGVLAQVMMNMRQNLTVQLRAGDCRQMLSFALADFRGVVDGKAYQMPFLSSILQQASQADAPAWLKNWKSFVDGGGLEKFQVDYAKMVKDLNKEFPYASMTYFNPEFGANWQTYGSKLGNFASFGIDSTLTFAQITNQALSEDQTNKFLYFDTIHNTESGQTMTARAMFLTLEANRKAIEGATLVDQKIGSLDDDCLVACKRNTELIGLAGADRLIGRSGNDALSGGSGCDVLIGDGGKDWLKGGENSDRLSGGSSADFFSWDAKDVKSSWVDTITDFCGKQGDRLGINAILDGDNPFNNKGWDFIGQQEFTGVAAELRFQKSWLLGDVDGDGTADLRIHLLGVKSFETSWIS